MKRLLLENFYSWSVFSEARQIDFNGHLWVGEGGNVVIDQVAISEADLAQLKQLGGAKLIVVTNRDHARVTEFFKEQTGAEVVAHEDDADSFPFSVSRTVVEGDEVVPGLGVIHLRYWESGGTRGSARPQAAADDPLAGAPGSPRLRPQDTHLGRSPAGAPQHGRGGTTSSLLSRREARPAVGALRTSHHRQH